MVDLSTLDPRFKVLLDNQEYYVEVYLYNQLDNFKPMAVPFAAIQSLVIEENLENWWVTGSIILLNDFEIFERGVPQTFGPDGNGKTGLTTVPSPYHFRSDGRNKISIKIFSIPNSDTILPEEKWDMNFDFVIYDIEDISTGNAQNKNRKYYFHDERYQILLERNIEWSTAKNDYQIVGLNATDDVRSLNSSLAIKSILSTAASNFSNPSSPVIMVGNTEGPSKIDAPNIPFNNINQELWDKGHPTDSKVIYTTPANSCVLDDIAYVSHSLKASDGSPLFLLFDRYYRNWSLVSLKDIFKDAEKNQIERLVIQDGVDTQYSKPYVQRAPFDPNGGNSSPVKNFQSGVASKITDYKFVPMIAADEIDLTNVPIHNYDFSKASFNVSFEGNTSVDLLNNLKTMVSDSLYSFKQKSGQLLFQINQTKKTGLMVDNKHMSRTFFPKDASYLNMAKRFLFLNEAMYFSTVGLTFRSPGNFVFIDRETSDGVPNVFDDKVLGQWLLTKVVHVFTQKSYTTEVIANKIDIFNKWFEEIDSKY